MLDDVTTFTTVTRRDARRRTRVAVAIYAICLVTLLAVGSYLAPPGTIAAPNGTTSEGGANLQTR